MIHPNEYPILEYDDSPSAVLEPAAFAGEPFPSDRLVITFFPEVMDRLKSEGRIALERVIPGENPLEIYRYAEDGVLITLGQVGCPACAGNLDAAWAMGIRRVMFCGGGGVLDRSIDVGQVLLVEGAIRDEGFSYHYAPPSRIICTDPETTEAIADALAARGVPFLRGITWTTDAIFRETRDKVALRRSEGAKIVEMEQAGCIAVARFRGFAYGALIYGGDDVSGETWDQRGWRSRKGMRYDLTELCRELTGVLGSMEQ